MGVEFTVTAAGLAAALNGHFTTPRSNQPIQLLHSQLVIIAQLSVQHRLLILVALPISLISRDHGDMHLCAYNQVHHGQHGVSHTVLCVSVVAVIPVYCVISIGYQRAFILQST